MVKAGTFFFGRLPVDFFFRYFGRFPVGIFLGLGTGYPIPSYSRFPKPVRLRPSTIEYIQIYLQN